ncbi:hypothetical protein [Rhodobacter calidifons]|uniref:Preprotein translocase subunit SecD n=1 Tax=Rhodobacter calidifons TaxID=2715277 RepID=A0ABX0G9V3_9RHOB|nr:hypothetical protein [Rhodobacter calidifons]NHB77901.1 hypothetical protein [Rhodobacter calidifons]
MRSSLAPAACLVSALAVAPALAEPPRISLVFGLDRMTVAAEDIRSVRRVDGQGQGAALVIRLAGRLDPVMSALTEAHVGETGELLICNELAVRPYLDAQIREAMFVISDTDIARIDRLQAMLTGPRCADRPGS